jgi:hypothetical protein
MFSVLQFYPLGHKGFGETRKLAEDQKWRELGAALCWSVPCAVRRIS